MTKNFEKATVNLRRCLDWIAVPVNLCLAALAATFLISLTSWAFVDRSTDAVLFFPTIRGDSLKGELRSLPRAWDLETRAESIASELLLGPQSPKLIPAFPPGIRVESSIYRNGRLIIDLSEIAALSDRKMLERGLKALERSLRIEVLRPKRILITVGGRVPFADAPSGASLSSAKMAKKN